MKQIQHLCLAMIMSVLLTACGSSTFTGHSATYFSADGSCSIELPAPEDSAWVVKEETPGNILDITDSQDTMNVRIQSLPKKQFPQMTSDLAAYEQYAMINVVGDIAFRTERKEEGFSVPEFVTNCRSYDISFTRGTSTINGALLFMESDDCWHTCLIIATKDVYKRNGKILLEQIMTLQANIR